MIVTPFCLNRAMISKEASDLLGRQRGGGFVQNQHLALARDRLGDLDELHLRDAEQLDFGLG